MQLRSSFLAFVLLCAAPSSVLAQSKAMTIGLEGGPALTTLRGNQILAQTSKIDFTFAGGLFVEYGFSDHLSIRTGCSFERKGNKSNILLLDINGSELGNVKVRTQLDYLAVPLLVRYSFGSKVKFMVNAGPYLGFLLKGTERTGAIGSFPERTTDRTANFTQQDVGLSLGLGPTLSMGDHIRISLEVRATLGLLNVSAIPVVENGSIKTSSAALLVGAAYVF